MKNRRKARELALRAYYALEMSKNDVEQTLTDMIYSRNEIDEDIITFACNLVRRATQRQDEFDQLIKEKALNWDFNRIAVLDKLILRIAICEFLTFEDIPPKVSIDEAIEISKKYSTEKSGQFINGILDSVLNDLKKQNRIVKSGRGLVDETI